MKAFSLLFLITATLIAAPATAPSPDATRLFKIRCAGCHGAQGEGGTGASFKRKLEHRNISSIEIVIKNGIPGTAMPASGLPDPAVKKLAAYVLYLNKQK